MKTFSKLTLCLAVFMGIVFETSSQNILVSGKVTAPDGTAIMGVHISDSISKIGTTSNENGIFILDIPQRATQLRFSHIAFNTKYLPLTTKILTDTIAAHTIWLDVVLTQRVKELPAAAISDSKVQIAWEDRKQWILDYELVGEDEMLLLLIEKNKRYLQLVNSAQEKISQIRIGKDYNQLFKDCFGYFHLLSKDSACQVFLEDDKLILHYYYTRQSFDQTIKPAVLHSDKYLFLKSFTTHGQFVLYEKINTETKEAMTFIENFEEEQAIFNRAYISHIIDTFVIKCNRELPNYVLTPEVMATFLEILIKSANMDEFIHSSWMIAPAEICRDAMRLIAFYKQTLSIPPYSLLTKINKSIYFFDHLNNVIQKYDLDGNYISEKEILYHHQTGWEKEIIVNEERTRCFAKFANAGETTLREIDPNTGKLIGDIVLEQHAFPSKIRIRGNYVYYRCRDLYEGEDRYFLWKQGIE